MGAPSILEETVATIASILGPALDGIVIERVVIGLFFTGVIVTGGAAGACATPIKTIEEETCNSASVRKMPLAGSLRGRNAIDLAREALAGNGIQRAVGIATINALADLCWRVRPSDAVDMQIGVDAFDATEIRPGDKIVVVGAFVPFLKELKRRRQPFLVLERNPAVLKPEEMPFFRPADQAAAVIPDADIVFATGSALVTDTLEEILALARRDARVTIVGPTVGMLPDAFLRHGADILGGIRVSDPDAFLDLLAEAGAGAHFFGRSVQKMVLSSRSTVAKVA